MLNIRSSEATIEVGDRKPTILDPKALRARSEKMIPLLTWGASKKQWSLLGGPVRGILLF